MDGFKVLNADETIKIAVGTNYDQNQIVRTIQIDAQGRIVINDYPHGSSPQADTVTVLGPRSELQCPEIEITGPIVFADGL